MNSWRPLVSGAADLIWRNSENGMKMGVIVWAGELIFTYQPQMSRYCLATALLWDCWQATAVLSVSLLKAGSRIKSCAISWIAF